MTWSCLRLMAKNDNLLSLLTQASHPQFRTKTALTYRSTPITLHANLSPPLGAVAPSDYSKPAVALQGRHLACLAPSAQSKTGIASDPTAPHAGVAQLVERQLPKLNVEGSSPFARSILPWALGRTASQSSTRVARGRRVETNDGGVPSVMPVGMRSVGLPSTTKAFSDAQGASSLKPTSRQPPVGGRHRLQNQIHRRTVAPPCSP